MRSVLAIRMTYASHCSTNASAAVKVTSLVQVAASSTTQKARRSRVATFRIHLVAASRFVTPESHVSDPAELVNKLVHFSVGLLFHLRLILAAFNIKELCHVILQSMLLQLILVVQHLDMNLFLAHSNMLYLNGMVAHAVGSVKAKQVSSLGILLRWNYKLRIARLSSAGYDALAISL